MAAERWLPPPRWGQCFLPFLFVVKEKETAVTSWIPILSTVTEIFSVVNPGFTLVKWTHLLYKQKSFKTDIAIAANTWNYLNTHWKDGLMRAWSRTFLENTWLDQEREFDWSSLRQLQITLMQFQKLLWQSNANKRTVCKLLFGQEKQTCCKFFSTIFKQCQHWKKIWIQI